MALWLRINMFGVGWIWFPCTYSTYKVSSTKIMWKFNYIRSVWLWISTNVRRDILVRCTHAGCFGHIVPTFGNDDAKLPNLFMNDIRVLSLRRQFFATFINSPHSKFKLCALLVFVCAICALTLLSCNTYSCHVHPAFRITEYSMLDAARSE